MKRNLFTFFLLFWAIIAQAQITTASINGKIKDAKGEEIPGATVMAVHTPTGTKYGVVTGIDGRYNISNMNPGGPYDITVSSIGYQNEVRKGLNLILGGNNDINFTIAEGTQQLQEVVVKGEKGGLKLALAQI